MKNHIQMRSLAKTLGVPPVELDRALSDENLDEDKIKFINDGIDELLKTWKFGIYAESKDNFKLIKPGTLEKYRRKKAKEAENGLRTNETV